MTNYKQNDISGSTWTRAFRVEINNRYNEIPSIEFREEDLFLLNGEVIQRQKPMSPTSSIRQFMTDPTTTFDLIDPNTKSFIGVATYKDVYIMMQSLYIKLAESRDKELVDALVEELANSAAKELRDKEVADLIAKQLHEKEAADLIAKEKTTT